MFRVLRERPRPASATEGGKLPIFPLVQKTLLRRSRFAARARLGRRAQATPPLVKKPGQGAGRAPGVAGGRCGPTNRFMSARIHAAASHRDQMRKINLSNIVRGSQGSQGKIHDRHGVGPRHRNGPRENARRGLVPFAGTGPRIFPVQRDPGRAGPAGSSAC